MMRFFTNFRLTTETQRTQRNSEHRISLGVLCASVVFQQFLMRLAVLLLMFCFVGVAVAQTTQPASLELRANEAFAAGEYAKAAPLLIKLKESYSDQPDKIAQIDEKLRVCQVAMARSEPAPGADPEMSPEKRKKHEKPADGAALNLTIKELGNFEFDMEKGGNIPEDVKALQGSRVRINGYMIPMDQAEAITQFALVPSLFACCFGQPPQLQHTIVVNCPKGKAVSYFADEIVVDGALKVEEKREDGFIISIFEIDCTSVKPANK